MLGIARLIINRFHHRSGDLEIMVIPIGRTVRLHHRSGDLEILEVVKGSVL